MSIRLYIPFRKNDFKHDNAISSTRTDLERTGLQFTTSRLRSAGQALTDVKDDDLLIVDGHGGVGSSAIYCETEYGATSLTAIDLARQLNAQGLPTTHQSILMGSCNAGGTSLKIRGSERGNLSKTESLGLDAQAAYFRIAADGLMIRNNAATKCFASVLAKALGELRYRSILVGGWPGAFSADSEYTSGNSVLKTEGGKRVLAQLDHIQWYDAAGVHQ